MTPEGLLGFANLAECSVHSRSWQGAILIVASLYTVGGLTFHTGYYVTW